MKCQNRTMLLAFHTNTLPVDDLQVGILPLRCENYNLCLFTLKSLTSIIYLLTPWNGILLEKLAYFKLVKKFPAFYGTWRFITAFTNARHMSLSCVRSIKSMPPHPTSWRLILILSSRLCLGLSSGLFPSGFPNKTLYTPILSPIRATCLAHLTLLLFITRTILGEEYRSFSSSLCITSIHVKILTSWLYKDAEAG